MTWASTLGCEEVAIELCSCRRKSCPAVLRHAQPTTVPRTHHAMISKAAGDEVGAASSILSSVACASVAAHE